MKKQKFVAVSIATVMSIMCLCILNPITVYGETKIQTQAAIDRKYELIDQGYDGAVVFDQLYEEFDHVDGPAGTGGIDGLRLDGTPADGVPYEESIKTKPLKPKHTHSWVEETIKDSTCIKQGENQFICDGCGEGYIEKIPLVDHNYVLTSQEAATCITHATVTFTCSMCGVSDTQEKEGFAEHKYVETDDTIAASCEDVGYQKFECSVCGDFYEETPKALGHEWSEEYTVDVEAGCTTEGKKTNHCVRCNLMKDGSAVAIAPTGHTENEVHQIVEPTFFNDGLETITCKYCNEVIGTNALPATGGIEYIILLLLGVVVILSIVIIVKRRK